MSELRKVVIYRASRPAQNNQAEWRQQARNSATGSGGHLEDDNQLNFEGISTIIAGQRNMVSESCPACGVPGQTTALT
jgi:hypothetical protein